MNKENPVPPFNDPFDPANLQMPAEAYRAGRDGDKTQGIRRYKKQSRIKWYRLEATVLDRAFATTRARRNAWNILVVLMALYELWFTDFDHRNPVTLTSYNLHRFGLRRKQKYRALEILEEAKLISVDQTHGKNPVVAMTWLPLRK
jgi:hypothetical protein